jgi:hypothetical protein
VKCILQTIYGCVNTRSLITQDITDEGIKSLLEALETNTTLAKLEIEGNPIFGKDLKSKVRV